MWTPLQSLKDAARDWALKVKDLIETDVPPELVKEKADLIERARKIKNTVESVLGTVDELAPIQTLGVWPVVAGGVTVAGAAAFITMWITDYKKLKARLAAVDKLVDAGIDRDQAHHIVENTTGIGKKSLLGINIGPLAALILGGVALWVLQ